MCALNRGRKVPGAAYADGEDGAGCDGLCLRRRDVWITGCGGGCYVVWQQIAQKETAVGIKLTAR